MTTKEKDALFGQRMGSAIHAGRFGLTGAMEAVYAYAEVTYDSEARQDRAAHTARTAIKNRLEQLPLRTTTRSTT